MNRTRLALTTGLIAAALLVPGAATAATNVLPDLGMMRLNGIQLDTSQPGRRLLRFSTRIANAGRGPFELNATRPNTSQPEMTDVKQRIYTDAGGSWATPTSAVLVFGGDGHNHWHVRDLELYELIRVDNGVKVGTGGKAGFCFWDNKEYNLSLPGAPQSKVYRSCGTTTSLMVTMGLSVGWADKYPWNLPDQYIDVTGLSNGRYRLQVTADPQNWFRESNESNQVTWTEIQISSSGVSVLRHGPRI